MHQARRLPEYDPRCFNVSDIAAAKRIILTPEQGRTTTERWAVETPHIVDLIVENMTIGPDSLILDYGCGIGRLSKELIARTGCRVVGADISASMRALAAAYVDSERFMACHPDMLKLWSGDFHGTIAVWVLQHVHDLPLALDQIAATSRDGTPLFVVNEGNHGGRVVPTTQGWVNDGVDLRATIADRYSIKAEGKLSADVVTPEVSERTFWAVYE